MKRHMLEFGFRTARDCASKDHQPPAWRSTATLILNAIHTAPCALAVFTLAALCALTPFTGWARAPQDSDLEAIIRRNLPANFEVTAQVVDLETGRVLMEKNPDLPLIPASTMKVVTTATALSFLKPDFTFVTQVLADKIRGGSVGNIYIKGYGDPHMVSEQLFALTREVRDKGLRKIKGDIIVDDSYFIPGKPLDENEKLGARAYHAPYGAVSLNFNSLKIVVHPGPAAGKPAQVIADPVSEYAVIRSSVQTVKGHKAAEIEAVKGGEADGREVIQVQGAIGAQAPSKGRYVNIDSPALYTGAVFKEFLLREGIAVSGKVIRGKVPESAELYLEFSSHPLGVLVYWLNKFSNNFMAEQISMAMGAQALGAPGTREKGLSVIRKFLASNGVKEGNFSLSEASGLSRNNQISASALVKVLRNTASDYTCGPEFMASFGVSGVDGTLKEKLNDPKAKRRVRAKTGNLRGVNAMAGFGLNPEGRVFVFAVIVNSLQKGTGFIDYADTIVRAILDVKSGDR